MKDSATAMARLQARLTDSETLTRDARRALAARHGPERSELAPFLDRCASDLEAAARAMRALADDAAGPREFGCSS